MSNPSTSFNNVASRLLALKHDNEFMCLFRGLDEKTRDSYFSLPKDSGSENTEEILDLLFSLLDPSGFCREVERQALQELKDGLPQDAYEECGEGENMLIEMDRRLLAAYRTYGNSLPLSVWHCCKRACFAVMASDPIEYLVFDEIMRIHEITRSIRKDLGEISLFVQSRGRGIGGSSVHSSHPTRRERNPNHQTDRQEVLSRLQKVVENVLPYLRGKEVSRTGVPSPRRSLCVNAISAILGVSNNFIYKRKTLATSQQGTSAELMKSIIDSAGVRMRQYRRIGLRTSYPEIDELTDYNCGCEEPCFAHAPVQRLQEWFNNFAKCSRQLRPRKKENRFLLNIMLCPLLNRPIEICNEALSALFTVSPGKIAAVRGVLRTICNDPNLDCIKTIEQAAVGYQYNGGHPMNRLNQSTRDKIEHFLDMSLRADPGASDGVNVCRVYDPEINTQEKLRRFLAQQLEDEDVVSNPLSSSTLYRIVNEYLVSRNCRISFTQSDHNACPQCKTMQYSVLQYSHERKVLAKRLSCLHEKHARPYTKTANELITQAELDLRAKENQENLTLKAMKSHVARDARIRGFLKRMTDLFKTTENVYRELERTESSASSLPKAWCSRKDHAMITHQDDMTKVDLPSFIINASSDITRWRYDVNAHVNAVTGECVVFSHEQGSGPKNASSISELIILDHILRCRGEAIKFVVSDNAAVGKNWMTTIALPQYMVDQGLAKMVVMVFLENNHGKWLADMLFGQLQIRRRKTTVPSVDALLSEFESIKKNSGSVQGFVVNPLACVDFNTLFESLGYTTSPPKDFHFVRRNIHFATACAPGFKDELPAHLLQAIGEMIPDAQGMVRICSEPPQGVAKDEMPFEDRYFDVSPAVQPLAVSVSDRFLNEVPLVVSTEQEYSDHGNCVVSSRNMLKVGYNGLVFRGLSAYPELRNMESSLVRESWPLDLLKLEEGKISDEPVSGSENLKTAPENWIIRRPVRRFRGADGDIVARYPPRNMLNARFGNKPREQFSRGVVRWRQVVTYNEDPFPTFEGTAENPAHSALLDFKEANNDPAKTTNVLEMLKAIYNRMGYRCGLVDPWMHVPASRPLPVVWDKYQEDLKLYAHRQEGCPRPARSLRQVFKADPQIKAKAAEIRRQGSSESLAKIVNRLYSEAEGTPGGLDRFKHKVAKDLERFARESKEFTEVTLRTFDERHNLLPRCSEESMNDSPV